MDARKAWKEAKAAARDAARVNHLRYEKGMVVFDNTHIDVAVNGYNITFHAGWDWRTQRVHIIAMRENVSAKLKRNGFGSPTLSVYSRASYWRSVHMGENGRLFMRPGKAHNKMFPAGLK